MCASVTSLDVEKYRRDSLFVKDVDKYRRASLFVKDRFNMSGLTGYARGCINAWTYVYMLYMYVLYCHVRLRQFGRPSCDRESTC